MIRAEIRDKSGESVLLSEGFWIENNTLFYEEDDACIARKDGATRAMRLCSDFSVTFHQSPEAVVLLNKAFSNFKEKISRKAGGML